MSGLIDATEMYLRTIYELLEEGIDPMRARIVERLHQTGPTVSQTVARMERDGLLTLGENRRIELSEIGLQEATKVMRRHRLAECALGSVLGMGWHQMHEEACRWEHVLSDQVEERLMAVLENPTVSPYGMPIPPPVDDYSVPDLGSFRRHLVDLVDALTGGDAAEGVLGAIGENVQADPYLLGRVVMAGLLPGVSVSVRRLDGLISVSASGGLSLALSEEVARGLALSRVQDPST